MRSCYRSPTTDTRAAMEAEQVEQLVSQEAKSKGADEEAAVHAGMLASGCVEDYGGDDPDGLETEVEDAIGGVLPELDAGDIKRLARKIAHGDNGNGNQNGFAVHGNDQKGEEAEEEGRDHLVKCDGMILAYAGRILLRKTSLFLRKGVVHAVLGENGCGKTTLLKQIARKQVSNVPEDLCAVYVEDPSASEEAWKPAVEFAAGSCQQQEAVREALREAGFDPETEERSLHELSGGWRMKAAVVRAIMSKPDLLLLDEPSNHLDSSSVDWLASLLLRCSCSSVVVSHDYNFVERVASVIIHFDGMQLSHYEGGFQAFLEARPDVALPGLERDEASPPDNSNGAHAEYEPEGPESLPMSFPDPGPLDGVRSRKKPVLSVQGVTVRYSDTVSPVLRRASFKVTPSSRVAILGKNASGKSTALKLVVGELERDPDEGSIWRHHNLRVSYVAQHSMHHLEESLHLTSLQYIQSRFLHGRDKELARLKSTQLTEEEEAQRNERGNIREIVGRQTKGGTLQYEVVKGGRKRDETQWEPLESLQRLQPYVMKLVRDYDEREKAIAAGTGNRPLTSTEVLSHLSSFGIGEDLAKQPLRRLSAGQRCRVVLAAAMWNKPHLVCMDEPTNYLDASTVSALISALNSFRGAFLAATHNDAFARAACKEAWRVVDGQLVSAESESE